AVHRHHQQLAMGEVHHANNTEDQGESDADNGVGSAQQQTVHDQLNQDIHGVIPSVGGRTPAADAARAACPVKALLLDDRLGNRGGFRPHGDEFSVLPLHQSSGHRLVLAVFSEVEAPAGGSGAHRALVSHDGFTQLGGVG